MKMKSTITAALLLIAPLYANAQVPSGYGDRDPYIAQPQSSSRNGDSIPTRARIEMKMKQIELDVAMKQFEKIQTALAETRVEAQLFDETLLGAEAYKEKTRRAEVKTARLMNLKIELQEEILKNVVEIEQYRMEYPLADEPVPDTTDLMIRVPRPPAPILPTPARPPGSPPPVAPSFNEVKPAPSGIPGLLPAAPATAPAPNPAPSAR